MEQFELDEIDESRNILLNWMIAAYPRAILELRLIKSMLGLPRPVGRGLTRKDLAMFKDCGLAETFVMALSGGDPEVYWRVTAKGKRFDEKNRPWEKVYAF